MLKSCCSTKPCAAVGMIMMVVLTLTQIAAVYGAYMALFGRPEATPYGSTASMAIIALALNTAVWTKYGQMHCKGTCSSSAS